MVDVVYRDRAATAVMRIAAGWQTTALGHMQLVLAPLVRPRRLVFDDFPSVEVVKNKDISARQTAIMERRLSYKVLCGRACTNPSAL